MRFGFGMQLSLPVVPLLLTFFFYLFLLWVLPPLSNNGITTIILLYIALNRTPDIDCYWEGAVPNFYYSMSLRTMAFGAVKQVTHGMYSLTSAWNLGLGFRV